MSLLAPVLVLAAASPAQDGWEQTSFRCDRPQACESADCCELSLAIFVRDDAATGLREVRATGEMDAPPAEIFRVLTDYDHYTEFMPYTVGSKLLWREGNEVVVWGMVDPPLIARRDWVTRSKLEPGGPGGVYRTTWWPEDKLGPPPEPGVVRLTKNSGSWTLVPVDGGKRTRGTYFTATSPGGSLPEFIVKAVSTSGIPALFAALRQRAAPH